MRNLALALVTIIATTAASAADWVARAPLPAPRCAGGSAVAIAGGSILLIGEGNDEYSLAGNSWSSNSAYPRSDGRTNLNSNAVVGTTIYFLGGTSVLHGFDSSAFDKYDAATDTWTLNIRSFLPNAGAATLANGNNIYSFGGTFLGAATLTFRYELATNNIVVLPELSEARARAAVVEHEGKFWVIGGSNGSPLTSVEVFDPVAVTWSSGPALPVASAARAAGVVGGDIHVLLDAGVYRLAGTSWTQVAPPPPQASDYAAIFNGDQLHAIGGCSTAHNVLSIDPTLLDTTPPVIASVTPSQSVLSTPNHKLVPVTINVVASDDTDPAPVAQIASVTSSEPDNGLGDGDTAGDIVITGPLTVKLRAERAAKGPGRTYTITVEVTDASGNSSTATTTVVVPRDQRK